MEKMRVLNKEKSQRVQIRSRIRLIPRNQALNLYSDDHLRSRSELLNGCPSSVDLDTQGSLNIFLENYSFSHIEPK